MSNIQYKIFINNRNISRLCNFLTQKIHTNYILYPKNKRSILKVTIIMMDFTMPIMVNISCLNLKEQSKN